MIVQKLLVVAVIKALGKKSNKKAAAIEEKIERLFNIHNRLLYGGLLEYVFKFAENRHYSIIPDGNWWKPKNIKKNPDLFLT